MSEKCPKCNHALSAVTEDGYCPRWNCDCHCVPEMAPGVRWDLGEWVPWYERYERMNDEEADRK